MEHKIFVETIQALKKQCLIDKKCSDAFKVILPNDYVSSYNNSIIIDQLLKILQLEMNDYNKDSIIEYFIYELNYGEKYYHGCITLNDEIIDISDENKLYDYLIKQKNE